MKAMRQSIQLPGYLDAVRARLKASRSPEERRYLEDILGFYKAHEVVDSYVDDGVVFDRVRQPGAQVKPPPFAVMRTAAGQPVVGETAADTGKESAGLSGTIVHRRPPLEIEADYFQKAPGGGALPPQGGDR
jgi:hypothetical protein